MKKKIILLGSKGMLGQMVNTYFLNLGYDVSIISARYDDQKREEFLKLIVEEGEGFIINCIGKIKQKTDNEKELFWVNSLLPLDLVENILPNQFLIHPSTDCVFDGKSDVFYTVNHKATANDAYGKSKRLGEVALQGQRQALVIRCSIIGPDISMEPKGLLGWFLSQPPAQKLYGYTDHLWNGITTLEWCKQLEIVLSNFNDFRDVDILQLGTTEVYSKFKMLNLFQKYFNTDFKIIPKETNNGFNRSLVADRNCIKLEQQLNELKLFVDEFTFKN